MGKRAGEKLSISLSFEDAVWLRDYAALYSGGNVSRAVAELVDLGRALEEADADLAAGRATPFEPVTKSHDRLAAQATSKASG